MAQDLGLLQIKLLILHVILKTRKTISYIDLHRIYATPTLVKIILTITHIKWTLYSYNKVAVACHVNYVLYLSEEFYQVVLILREDLNYICCVHRAIGWKLHLQKGWKFHISKTVIKILNNDIVKYCSPNIMHGRSKKYNKTQPQTDWVWHSTLN